jgi:outer membrane protein
MNQKIVNIALSLAIVVLLVLNFSKKGSSTAVSNGKTDSTQVLKFAYVDLDSLQEKYVYYQEKTKEFNSKKEAADRDLNAAFQKIDNERVAFIQRGQSVTQAEAENFQRVYQGKMQNLEEQKKQLENNIATEGMKTMEELKKTMNAFLEEYNKDKKYTFIFSFSIAMDVLFYKDKSFDITNDVVDGLNKAYKKVNPSK